LPPLYQTNDRFKDRIPTDLRLYCTNDLDYRDELELPSLVYTSLKTAYGHCTTEAVPHIGLHYLSYNRRWLQLPKMSEVRELEMTFYGNALWTLSSGL